MLVLVSHKIEKGELARRISSRPRWGGEDRCARDRLPDRAAIPPSDRADRPAASRANGAPMPTLEEEEYTAFAEALMLARRARPAEGGYSVGHYQITAGTIGTCVYDILPGGTTRPADPRSGEPAPTYILSNNHVLANTNTAQPGDPILQPGPYDGGTDPADRIATLTRFVPITLEPPTPRNLHRNVVDAAIAQGQFHDLDREIYWIGYVRGWRRKANVAVGTIVQKTGRTTNYTTGRITAINATVDVGYGGGRVARFLDQISRPTSRPAGTRLARPELDNVAVGLLFAGSSVATIVNQIENVRSSCAWRSPRRSSNRHFTEVEASRPIASGRARRLACPSR